MSRKTVLLVDDDPVFREAIGAVLGGDYDVRTAGNGEEGLAEVAKTHPDLIILDVMMDHISEGFDVARALRNDPETQSIPIIMLTGVDEFYNVRMEVDESWVPCDRYLEKPVSSADLLNHVKELIG